MIKGEETVDEKALIKRCQRGDRRAFDELIRRYYDYVSGFLLKNTMDAPLCENLTQETFLKMIRSIERFDPGGRFCRRGDGRGEAPGPPCNCALSMV